MNPDNQVVIPPVFLTGLQDTTNFTVRRSGRRLILTPAPEPTEPNALEHVAWRHTRCL
ncbi:MAG: hypothetical protein J4G13_15950 [Dehalococcoidia bacterium]|nr:hypothetical protein [Dehalococcoidia bacterium]